MSDTSTDSGSMAPGASDAGQSAPSPGYGADSSTSGAPAPAGAPASSTLDELSPEPPSGINTFDRAYVTKVREEAARHRTAAHEASERLKGYEVFESYDADDRAVWVNLAHAWQRDPNEAARMMQQIATGVLGDGDVATTEPELDTPVVDGDGPLTRADVAALIEEREFQRTQQSRLDAEVAEVVRTVSDAGYAPGSPEHASILWRAANTHNGDLDAAIAAHKAYEQGVIDRYVAGKTGNPMSPNGGASATQHTEIKTLREATKAAEEWLRNNRTPGG